ncbi:MAG: DUF4286 family protein [Ignavibacteriae bacterium]|nr:DUF4286 family protein [Ignavibacteriota bacterium]MCB9217376.1 DUF4286 family protein [Ignavibacteria bacterium]
MTIYEVNIRALKEIADSYETWLSTHINEIIQLDGFISAEWSLVEEDQETKDLEEAVRQAVRLDESVPHEIREAAAAPVETKLYCIQYRLRDRESLENYFTHHVESMRQDGIDRFGTKFAATRRVMKLYRIFEPTAEE